MRILLTGGAGFIGSNLARILVRSGNTVLNIDNLTYAGNLQSLSDIENNSRYIFSKTDICDQNAIERLFTEFNPQAVLHLAAESHVDRSIERPSQFIETNVIGTFSLLQAALKYWKQLSPTDACAFRFIHVSTDEVYGSLGPSGFFTETTPYKPHSPYSASKASSDHLARAWYDTYRLPVIVTNCSNNYGPYQFPEKLVPLVILKCLHDEAIPVYGTGENVRDWLYVEDHCDALRIILERGQPGQTYNIGGNNELRNIDLVHSLCSLLDELAPSSHGRPYQNQISFVKDRPGHDLRYAIDASKIRNELDWTPSHDPASGLRKTVTWYLENRSWWSAILDRSYQLQRIGLSQK